jgi:ATP-dependent Zn protease
MFVGLELHVYVTYLSKQKRSPAIIFIDEIDAWVEPEEKAICQAER